MMIRSFPSLVCLIIFGAALVATVLCQSCTYTTTCYHQKHWTSACGTFGWRRCGRYSSVAASCTGTASCTNTLLSCDSCSKTCGVGSLSCTHQCKGVHCSLPSTVQNESCNTHNCPIPGGWTDWGDWTYDTCSVTCDGGLQVRTRSRSCTNPIPQYGGEPCEGNTTESETIRCNTDDCPPIPGGWTDWGDWTYDTCSVTCGGGLQGRTRSRSCTNPMPQNGGEPCQGNTTESETIPCNPDDCPPKVHGGWSLWGKWRNSNCSRSCGGGIRVRYQIRSCTKPAPMNGGDQCVGLTYKQKGYVCNTKTCPKPKIRENLDLKSLLDAMFSDKLTCTEGEQRVNIDYCEKFQVCINNTWQEMECNNGTVYNSYTEACNWPVNVPGCTSTSNIISMDTETRGEDGSECSSEECACQEGIDEIVSHPTDCTKFIICATNKPFVESCADHTYWNQRMLSCQSGTC